MGLSKPKTFVTVAEYLAGEQESPVRYEYVMGQVYAMAGASDRHNRIALNLATRFSLHLDGKRCEAFISDMKVRVAEDVFYYPDVVVACDPPGGDAYFRSQPVVIVEVLSPTTERIDRNEKLAAYQRVSTLREYVLLSQDGLTAEFHHRTAEGEWTSVRLDQPEEELPFASIGLTLTLADVYRNVRFPETETPSTT